MLKRSAQAFATCVLLSAAQFCAWAAPPADLDARIEAAMQQHGVPGLSLAIVENGDVVKARGYGVRKLGEAATVDADTIFPTGSTGKAVTAAALAILVDEGKLGWDDAVIDHLPDFRMHDAWVTREMTVRDLLVHRSGLGLGAGDLLYIPRTSRSRADVVRALRHIPLATSFRSAYAYDNILYLVAGELIAAVSGLSYEAFIQQRVFAPAGMTASVADEHLRFANPNRAHPHARTDGAIRGVGSQQVLPEREGLGQVLAPAGGLSSSANDMGRWLQIQLAQGQLPQASTRLYSQAVAREMWTPQVLMPIRAQPAPIADVTPQFSAYALGWTVQDYRGVRIIQHGGAVFGVLTLVTIIPEKNIGISVQINSEDASVMRGITYELLDHYLGFEQRDWVDAYAQFTRNRQAAAMEAVKAIGTGARASHARLPRALDAYAGDYRDAWYGPMRVSTQAGRLRMDFRMTPGMAGAMTHIEHDVFRVDWDDSAIEPALVSYWFDAKGKVAQVRMQAVSPLADFSYNYQDLRFLPDGGE